MLFKNLSNQITSTVAELFQKKTKFTMINFLLNEKKTPKLNILPGYHNSSISILSNISCICNINKIKLTITAKGGSNTF